jgi:hypothetical protein
MSEASQFFDDASRKVLISSHWSRVMPSRVPVALDGLCEILGVGFPILPGGFEVENTESRRVLEKSRMGGKEGER